MVAIVKLEFMYTLYRLYVTYLYALISFGRRFYEVSQKAAYNEEQKKHMPI